MNRLSFLLPLDYGATVDVKLYLYSDLGAQVGVTLTATRQARSRYYLAETTIAVGEYSADVFTSGGDFIASIAVKLKLITAAEQAAAYSARLLSEGKTLSSTGLEVVTAVYQAAIDESVDISSGWLFGSEVNLDSPSKVKNLNANADDLVPQGSLNVATVNTAAMLGMRVDGSNQGLRTENNTPLFTNESDYSVLLLGSFNGDNDTVTYGRQHQPWILDQGTDPSNTGNLQLVCSLTGNCQWIDRPSSTFSPPGDLYSDNWVMAYGMWWAFATNPTYRMGHVRGAYTSNQTFQGDPSNKTFRIGSRGSTPENADHGYAVCIRFDGAMTDAQRTNVYNAIWSAWRKIGEAALVLGNSVTITGTSNPSLAWPKRMMRWGVYNNLIVDRLAQGAKRLPLFAPTGYTLPPGSQTDGEVSVRPVNGYAWLAANILINDDQQNMIAARQPWASFLDCHNAIVAFFAALNADQRAIICTQIAHAPYEFGTYNPLTFAQVQSQRQRFLDATVAARAESAYNGVPTTVGEVYEPFNLGWDTPDDGDPPDPANDLPNGDTSLFATNDAQHPNDDGHLAMFNAYRIAYEAVLLL